MTKEKEIEGLINRLEELMCLGFEILERLNSEKRAVPAAMLRGPLRGKHDPQCGNPCPPGDSFLLCRRCEDYVPGKNQ